MLLIRGAEVYAPEYLGKKDVLVAGGKIERIADHLPDYEGAEVIDGEGKILTPGIIDRHVHITGGGGEGSFHTQAPPVQLSRLLLGGVTTVVGVLGNRRHQPERGKSGGKGEILEGRGNFRLLLLRRLRISGSDHYRIHQ